MALSGAIAFTAYGERRVTTLNDGWEFKKVMQPPKARGRK